MRLLSQRHFNALLGLFLGLGAPAGLFLVRSVAAGVLPLEPVLRLELQRDPLTYGYLAIASSLAFAIFGYALGRSQEAVAREALRDPLTGLANRRALRHRLERELGHCSRQRPLTLLLIDVDGLKRINDQNGHKQGDDALKTVATAIESTSRGLDLAVRYGGDEYILLAPATNTEQGREIAERLRSTLRGMPVASLARPVTVSVGVASAEDSRASADGLLQTADAALYRAKAQGRDCVVSAPSQEQPAKGDT